MPGGRGGRRQGTPGKAYTNRTDLAQDYAQPTAEHTPASGGVEPQPQAEPQPVPVTPDQIPKLDDPTARPDQPVTAPGMTMPGGDGIIDDLYRAYQMHPTEQLRRSIQMYHLRYGTPNG